MSDLLVAHFLARRRGAARNIGRPKESAGDDNGGVEREDWNRRFRERGLVHGGEPDPTVVAEVEALAPGRALDLGCGQGRHGVWLARRGWKVTGVDFSDVALTVAR